MKLLRVGQKGSEKPAILDKDEKIRDLSSHIQDLNPDTLNFKTISDLQNLDLSSLPELSSSDRIGYCVSKQDKFISIDLNLLKPSVLQYKNFSEAQLMDLMIISK